MIGAKGESAIAIVGEHERKCSKRMLERQSALKRIKIREAARIKGVFESGLISNRWISAGRAM